jgi:hypothetical protein|tara:strand:- start:44 stop:730 length:687 start_codon:yes stop_codon:yes gene_type:complete
VNLLISMGDSWTAGVGCYNGTALDQLSRKEIHIDELMPLSLDSFAEGCWPKQLTDNLGWDLINLSIGGCSNSGQAKILFDSIPDDLCKKYDNVFVIWLLSDAYRPSFYVDGKVRSWHGEEKFTKLCIKYARPRIEDAILDTNFYVKCVDKFCKSNGYHFLFGNAFGINHSLNSSHNMHNYLKNDAFSNCVSPEGFSFCGHPNAHGYSLIAGKIQEVIIMTLNIQRSQK